jgi:hypothetical protein
MMRIRLFICTVMICVLAACAAAAQQVSAPDPQTGTIIGTVTDVQDDIVPSAVVVLEGQDPSDKRTISANENGFFTFNQVKPGIPYHVTVSAPGFANSTLPTVTLTPGQYLDVKSIQLKIAVVVTTVAVAPASSVELATEQVHAEEQQRVLGFIPNFYVVYDHNAAPLTAKLKFRLAMKTMTDPVTFAGSAFIAAIDQAADTPDYVQGWKGYGQRFGANYANGLTDIMIGGAILPSILHQDPRYFYQGTGTNKSRTLHALSSPFICKGDNGRWQPNFSSLGGYLASGAIADVYYPESNRGPGLVFGTMGIDIAANMANALIQEFVLRKLTPSAKNQNYASVDSAGH